MMIWIRNTIRKIIAGRRTCRTPPSVQPENLHQARHQEARADEALRWVEAQDSVINKASDRAARIHRENNLGPAFMRVLRGSRDA